MTKRGDDEDVLASVFPSIGGATEFTVVAEGRATAPERAAIDRAAAGLGSHACAPGEGFLLCRRGPHGVTGRTGWWVVGGGSGAGLDEVARTHV